MPKHKVLYTDNSFKSIDIEKRIVEKAAAELIVAQCQTPEHVIELAEKADALLVQWAPITAEVVHSLKNCKVIVRLGIGVDNIDLEAASANGVPVCNVPDYCIDEVADHTIAMALTLARQIPFIDRRLRNNEWQITPVSSMPAFCEMTFGSVGFGRIAKAVLERAHSFGFKRLAHDPFISDNIFKEAGVAKVSLNEIFTSSDIISLHCPLTPESEHLVNKSRLHQMKSTAILINTARGALVDTVALAKALTAGEIAYAGLDVFEREPLSKAHPLLLCENAILTSHVAWYSEQSVPELQMKAAEEIVRGLGNKPLKNQIKI